MPVTPDQWDALGVRGPLHLARILEAELEEREMRGDAEVLALVRRADEASRPGVHAHHPGVLDVEAVPAEQASARYSLLIFI